MTTSTLESSWLLQSSAVSAWSISTLSESCLSLQSTNSSTSPLLSWLSVSSAKCGFWSSTHRFRYQWPPTSSTDARWWDYRFLLIEPWLLTILRWVPYLNCGLRSWSLWFDWLRNVVSEYEPYLELWPVSAARSPLVSESTVPTLCSSNSSLFLSFLPTESLLHSS